MAGHNMHRDFETTNNTLGNAGGCDGVMATVLQVFVFGGKKEWSST